MPRTDPAAHPLDSGMAVIVPSRGRPGSVARVAQAWSDTDAWRDAQLIFAVDADDPTHAAYLEQISTHGGQTFLVTLPEWKPMVHKLDKCALITAESGFSMVGFMGDDHLPRTPGWARRYAETLDELGTGIVHSSDGFRDDQLPTQWMMTADIVRTLGRMVPAPVEHLYCDNAIEDLGRSAQCIRFLPDVLIEHMHPFAGKAGMDAGYSKVNNPSQYAKDRAAYQEWRTHQLAEDAGKIRALREAQHGQ